VLIVMTSRKARGIALNTRPPQRKLDSLTALEPLPGRDANRADRTRPRHVGSTARGQIEVLDVDQPQRPLARRLLAKVASPPLLQRSRNGWSPADLPRQSGWPRPRQTRFRRA